LPPRPTVMHDYYPNSHGAPGQKYSKVRGLGDSGTVVSLLGRSTMLNAVSLVDLLLKLVITAY